LAPEAEPFGLATERVSEGAILRKWMGVQLEIREDKQVLARCRESASSCPLAARHFLAIVDEGRARNGRARVGVINREINLSIVPTSDLAQWGVPDRWSAPLETFTTGRGDCEDYAIAKYVALRATGIAPEDIKLVVVRNTDASENHAVVAVRLGGTWVILDNRWLAMVPDRDVWSATPLFEIRETACVSSWRRRRTLSCGTAPLHRSSSPTRRGNLAYLVSASYTPSQSGPGGCAR
jgi:predicted transglutaminase-like cysteine proteinase